MQEEKNLKRIAREGSQDLSHFFNVGPDGLYWKKYKVKSFALSDSVDISDLNFPRIYKNIVKSGVYIVLEPRQ